MAGTVGRDTTAVELEGRTETLHTPRPMPLQRVTAVTASMLMVGMLATATSGCTSMRTIRPVSAPGAPPWGELKAGDTVILQTPDGERWRFVVQQIDGDAIVAPNGQRYRRSDIVKLQQKSFSTPKTVCLIATIAGGIYVAIGIAVVSALDSAWGGP